MENMDGLKLQPLFYSEITSSCMLEDLFKNHQEIARGFLETYLNISAVKNLNIARERRYQGRGSVDLFFSFEVNDVPYQVLIEVKVHDFLSATPGQIKTYYEAAVKEQPQGHIYIIYLTQFNKKNVGCMTNIPTLDEFDKARHELRKYENNLLHLNWAEVHSFIEKYDHLLSPEQITMLHLHRQWILAKNKKELQDNAVEVGTRNLLDYFDDVDIALDTLISLGEIKEKNRREILVIDLNKCSAVQLAELLKIIQAFSQSQKINRKAIKQTEEFTLRAVKDFLASLVENESDWNQLSFYASLFNLVNAADDLYLNGTGTRGFSIIVDITGKGNVSLCTLWSNKTIEFSLKR